MSQTAPHIVVVEDDPSITVGLRMNLEAEGYRVTIADDGEAGLAEARGDDVDLLILDVMLPHVNGLEILRILRKEGRTMPIIVLSARSSEIDKVMGLELGAEDYVTKPFGLAEFLARGRCRLDAYPILRDTDGGQRRQHQHEQQRVLQGFEECSTGR